MKWRYVNIEENPADLASRGGPVDQSDLWWSGPSWLSDCEQWPPNITTSSLPESQAEEKVLKEIFKFSEVRSDDLEILMKKFQFWKVVRVCARIARFADNARKSKKNRLSGPLTTGETEKQMMWWVERAQESVQCREVFARNRMQLNLQPNDEGVLECRGRIQGQYPIYLRDCHEFTAKVVSKAHLKTSTPKVGKVVIIKLSKKNRWKWKLEVVEAVIPGIDNVVRGARVRTEKLVVERAVQRLFPLELSCDNTESGRTSYFLQVKHKLA